jgi:stringent starvation protein B
VADAHPPPASKKEALLALLDRGVTMIHLDARREGVDVPEHLSTEHHLRLNVSFRFDPPDLVVDDWGVRSTLQFRGVRHLCRVPWHALFAVTQGGERGWLWPQDLPPELLEGMEPVPDPAPERPPLHVVPDEPAPPEESAGEPAAPVDGSQDPPPRGPPRLRLVK